MTATALDYPLTRASAEPPPDPPDVVGFVVWCAITIFATALAGALWTV